MRMRYAILLFCAAVFGIGAQAAPRLGLPEAAKSQLVSTDVVVAIRQPAIYIALPHGTLAQTIIAGPIPELIELGTNAVRTAQMTDDVMTLRTALTGYDFDQTFVAEIKSALATQPFLNVANVMLTKDVSANLENSLTQSKAAAVLVIWVDYHLDKDAWALTLTVGANLYPNSDALKALRQGAPNDHPLAPRNAIYRSVLSRSQLLPGLKSKDSREMYIAGWSADNAAQMRDAMHYLSANLANKLAADLAVTAN